MWNFSHWREPSFQSVYQPASLGGEPLCPASGITTISGNGAVNDSTSVGSKQKLDVGADQDVSVGGNRSLSVSGNQSVTVGGDQTMKIGGKEVVDIGSVRFGSTE